MGRAADAAEAGDRGEVLRIEGQGLVVGVRGGCLIALLLREESKTDERIQAVRAG